MNSAFKKVKKSLDNIFLKHTGKIQERYILNFGHFKPHILK